MKPSFSAHGSAVTPTLPQNRVDGMSVHAPSPLNFHLYKEQGSSEMLAKSNVQDVILLGRLLISKTGRNGLYS